MLSWGGGGGGTGSSQSSPQVPQSGWSQSGGWQASTSPHQAKKPTSATRTGLIFPPQFTSFHTGFRCEIGAMEQRKQSSRSKSSQSELLEREEESEFSGNEGEEELDQALSTTLLSTNMSDLGHEELSITDEEEPSERTVSTVATSLAGYHSKHQPTVSQKPPTGEMAKKRESFSTLAGVSITRLSVGGKRSLSTTTTSSVFEDSQLPASKRRKTLLNKKKILSETHLSVVEDEVSEYNDIIYIGLYQ